VPPAEEIASSAQPKTERGWLDGYALAWNLSPRQEGKRRGPSPYARMGIDFADDARPWHQILLEQMDAN
jgi:hypothetical protein